jgi:hypothetical protein
VRWYRFPVPEFRARLANGGRSRLASTCENLHRSYHLADTSLLVVYPASGAGKKERERERKRESEVNRVVVANSSAVVDERRGRRTTRSSDVSGSSANAGVGGGGGGGEGWAKVRRQGRADARAGERASGRRASGVGARRGGWLKEGMTPRTTGVNRCTMLPVSHSHGSSSLALILRTRRAREGPAKCA